MVEGARWGGSRSLEVEGLVGGGDYIFEYVLIWLYF